MEEHSFETVFPLVLLPAGGAKGEKMALRRKQIVGKAEIGSGAGPAQPVGSEDQVLDRPSEDLGLNLNSETSQGVIWSMFLFSPRFNFFTCKAELIRALAPCPILPEVLQSSEEKMLVE